MKFRVYTNYFKLSNSKYKQDVSMSIVIVEISLIKTFTQKSFGSTEIRGEFAILNIRCCFGMKGIFLLF